MTGRTNKLGALCAIALVLSGCANMTPAKQDGLIYGAGMGAAIGAAIGCGASEASSEYYIGCPAGAVGGGLIGGVLGYLIAEEPTPPPTPPKVIPPPPPPPPPPAAAVKERIVLRGVHFDFNKANIRSDAAPILDEAADILSKHPDVTVDVDGYCDAIGSYAYNLKLSKRRADSVAEYLEGKGIAASRLITHGYGKTHFVATNRTAEGRAQNRRVELIPVSN